MNNFRMNFKNGVLLTALSVAVALGSCSTNQIEVPSTEGDPTYITLQPFTGTATKAADATITTLQAVGKFKVYTVEGDAPTGFGIMADYEYTSGKWSWDKQWVDIQAFPATFYATFPDKTLTFGTAANGYRPTFTFHVKSGESDAAAQVDLIAASSTATTIPSSGSIPFSFNHILSKIDFSLIVQPGLRAHVQSVKIMNVADTATYTMGQDWSGHKAPGIKSFGYLPVAETKSIDGSGTSITNPALLAPNGGSMMMIPQNKVIAPTWVNPGSGGDVATSLTTGTYIELVYRLEDITVAGTPQNLVGYAASGSDGARFVKVAYPFEANWASNTHYTYTISLGTPGSSGGALINDRFIDAAGDPITGTTVTDPTTNTPIKVGDPIVKLSSMIDVNVSVRPWGDNGSGTVAPPVNKKIGAIHFNLKSTDIAYTPTRVEGFDGDTYTIPVIVPRRKDYTLVEWSTVNATTGGTVYQPGATITLTPGLTTLYPRWRRNRADILYLKSDGTLAVGDWKEDALTQSQIVYFKYGSVVGISVSAATGGTFGNVSNRIIYNPTRLTVGTAADNANIQTYGTDSNVLPAIPGWTWADWTTYNSQTDDAVKATWRASGSNYHTQANILNQGKGDPCRLVGLTKANIEAGTFDSGLWRMPTSAETHSFVGFRGGELVPTALYPYPFYGDMSGAPMASGSLTSFGGGWFPVSGGTHITQTTGRSLNSGNSSFLPSLSFLGTGGVNSAVDAALGSRGFYWSDHPFVDVASPATPRSVRLTYITSSSFDPRTGVSSAASAPIRCVRQEVVVD